MRTTVTLAPDVAAAVQERRRSTGDGVSSAINALVRAGLTPAREAVRPFEQRTSPMNAKVDVRNIGEVLDLLDDAAAR